jgi:hypothetical protein
MWNIMDAELLGEIWRALKAPNVSRQSRTITELASKILKQGRADIYDVQDLVWAMDGRFADSRIGDVVRAFNIPTTGMYSRPKTGQDEVIGSMSLAMADVAWLLIQMERIGFDIDPTVLVDPILQNIKKHSHLTDGELLIFWYHKQRRKHAPITLVANPEGIGQKVDEIRTVTNYRVELWKNPEDRVSMLGIFPARASIPKKAA